MDTDSERRALDLVAPHCDIVERLTLVPPTARLRGVLFHAIETQLDRLGKRAAYRELFPDEHRSSVPYYPLGDYLLRIACAGALVTSPAELHAGMHEVSRGNARAFAESLLGRTLIRLLARDPVRITEQGLAAQRQMSSYSHWEILRHGPRTIEMRYVDEYTWIESSIAGSAVGTYEACGLHPTIETHLVDRFNGSTIVRW